MSGTAIHFFNQTTDTLSSVKFMETSISNPILIFFGLLIFFGFINRLREIFDFDGWFQQSPFAKVKSPFWYKFFRSYTKDKILYIYPLKWIQSVFGKKHKTLNKLAEIKIHNHPMFYDAYHFTKNLSVMVLIIVLSSGLHWLYTIAGFFVWWAVQTITYIFFVDELQKKITRTDI